MKEPRIILCEHCGSEGRIYSGHPNDPNPRDEGPCQVCHGTGSEIIETEPIEIEDLDQASGCPDCGAQINPMLYPCLEKTCPYGEAFAPSHRQGQKHNP